MPPSKGFAIESAHEVLHIPPVLETVAKERQKGGVRNVAEYVRDRAAGVVLKQLPKEDVFWYRIAENEKMAELEERIRRIAEDVVAPAIDAYVRERFPTEYEAGEFRCETDIELAVVNSPTQLSEILGEERRPDGRLLWMCTVKGDGASRKVQVEAYLDEFLQSIAEEAFDDETINDVATQVLLHEFCHALSAKFYLSGEGEFEIARRVSALRNSVAGIPQQPEFDSLYSRLGYSCNFAAPADDGDPIRTFPIINEMNEAITDIIAARIYSRICRKEGFASGGFTVSYGDECSALHQSIREFSDESGRSVGEIYRELEAGYFLKDPTFLKTWENVLLPIASAFSEIVSDMRAAERSRKIEEGFLKTMVL